VNPSHHPRLRHRHKYPVTISPLESAFTNRDARNLFRIRFYENCRVSPTIFLSFFFRPSLHSTNQLSVVPFFSHSYELRILQVLCFDIHTKCPGCTPLLLHSLFNSQLVVATRHFLLSLFLQELAQPPFPGVLKVIQNTSTLSPSRSAVTRSGYVSPLECAVPKKTGGGVVIPESTVTILACVMIPFRSVKASAS